MQWAKDHDLNWNKKSRWLTEEVRSAVAEEVLEHLRQRSQERGTPLPDTVQMVRGVIFVDDSGELDESATAIASNSVSAP